MNNRKIQLFTNEKDCCGCGACQNVCPRDAIVMQKDERGFLYPHIDETKCIQCGQCMAVCAFQDTDSRDATPISAYAAVSKNDSLLKRSTSGGIFAALANRILMQGGLVFGCAYGDDFSVSHIEISSVQELHKIQGSKYVQSDTATTFAKVKQNLEAGKTVLYSGTPCQIAALRKYLKKDYPDFYCVDLICHGVGSPVLFEEDIKYLSKNKKITKIDFRDKAHGWGTSGTIFTANKRIKFDTIHSAYYYYYLDNAIYRESCYHCRYPSEKRPGDLTLGDYWRIESAHPGIERSIDIKRGVSCVLVNTPQGQRLMEMIKADTELFPSEYSKIRQRNGQLVHCCSKPQNRERIFDIYTSSGYPALVKYWRKTTLKKRTLQRMKNMIPHKLKCFLKRHI